MNFQCPEFQINLFNQSIFSSITSEGGGFGGKMELRPWEFCAAFMAKRTGRPVKFVLSRAEELATGRTRHAMKIRSKVGFKKENTFLSM